MPPETLHPLCLATFADMQGFAPLDIKQMIGTQAGYLPKCFSREDTEGLNSSRLFAYLFQRFGYPNAKWDPLLHLAAYTFTTPNPDVLLVVHPTVPAGDRNAHRTVANQQMSVMVRQTTLDRIIQYNHRGMDVWLQAMFDWAESRPKPKWMKDWLAFCLRRDPRVKSFRETVPLIVEIQTTSNIGRGTLKLVIQYLAMIKEKYSAIQPPPTVERNGWLESWPSDDPLKHVALAASIAANSLSETVGSTRFTFFYKTLEEQLQGMNHSPSKVGNTACGLLANADPTGYTTLQDSVLELGGNDPLTGINAATGMLAGMLSLAKRMGKS